MTMDWYWWVIGYFVVLALLLRINYGIAQMNKQFDGEDA